MLNESVWVPNETAAITLFKDALVGFPSKLIPDIYGWNGASTTSSELRRFSWILQEYMPSVSLDKHFPSLPFDQKRIILQQIAQVFKMIQSYELPSSITMYGGLRFNAKGEIVSGPLTIPLGSPFTNYKDMWQQNLTTQIKNSEKSEFIRGWDHTDGLRERLHSFWKSNGIGNLLKDHSDPRVTLVHGDLG
jgi:hypothetical protein